MNSHDQTVKIIFDLFVIKDLSWPLQVLVMLSLNYSYFPDFFIGFTAPFKTSKITLKRKSLSKRLIEISQRTCFKVVMTQWLANIATSLPHPFVKVS